MKNLKIISFGINKNSDIYPLSIKKKKNNKILSVKLGNKIIKIKFKNLNIYNILSSLAVLSVLKLNIKKIIKYYENLEPSEGRGKIYNVNRYKKNFKLIDESYNANPLSVKNAIKNLNSIKKLKFKKYLILGDMLELGKNQKRCMRIYQKLLTIQILIKFLLKAIKLLLPIRILIRKNVVTFFSKKKM